MVSCNVGSGGEEACGVDPRVHLEQELVKLEDEVGGGLAVVEAAKKLSADARAEKCSALSERLTRIQVLALDNHFTKTCCGTEAGSCLRLIDSCITQLKAQGHFRACNESKEEEEEACP